MKPVSRLRSKQMSSGNFTTIIASLLSQEQTLSPGIHGGLQEAGRFMSLSLWMWGSQAGALEAGGFLGRSK